MPSDRSGLAEPATAIAHPGRYSDGRTAASRIVAAQIGPDGLEIVLAGAGERRVWPYASLSAARPVHGRDGDVLLKCAAEPGATVFVTSPLFARALLDRAPQLSAHAQRWRYLKPALGLVALVAIASGATWLAGLSPARGLARLVPSATWRVAGHHLMAGFEREFGTCTDPAGRAALDRLVGRLATAAGNAERFEVHVVGWPLVNAFATPGRHLMLTRGLLQSARTPEEVAGVIAHEMGHGLELHPETSIVRALGLTLALKLVFAGASETIQSVGGLLLQLRYTRDAEREADQRAFDLLQKAGISAKPLAEFFDRMDRQEGGARGATTRYELLSTHPALAERARLARSRPDYPARPALDDAEWQALKGICGSRQPATEPVSSNPR